MKNQLKTIALLGGLSALLIGIGSAVSPGHLGFFVVLALAMNLGAYFFSDRLVLRMHQAQEVGPEQAPELYRMVGELAAKAGIPRPRLVLIPEQQPNAFATGRNPQHGVIAVTEGLLEVLSRCELRGVLAHEIAHIRNRDILVSSIAAVLSSVITSLGNSLGWLAMLGGQSDEEGERHAGSGLLFALLAPIAATLVQLGISRSREYLADETGARLAGDPEGLASALMKLERGRAVVPVLDPKPATASLFIVNPLFGMGSLWSAFSTHPSTEDRVRRLMELAQRGELRRPWAVRGWFPARSE